MNLNLGGGKDWSEKGWKNLDLDNGYDLSEKYLTDFPDESVALIYTSHCIEHIEFKKAYRLLVDCYRVLKKEGTIRIVVPDVDILSDILLNKNFEWLKKRNSFYYSQVPDLVFLDHIFELSGLSGALLGDSSSTDHKSFFSFSVLSIMLTNIGFKNVKKCEFCVSDIEGLRQEATLNTSGMPIKGFDNKKTAFLSLYMEATK